MTATTTRGDGVRICGVCQKPVQWEQIQGMRVHDAHGAYKTRCDCGDISRTADGVPVPPKTATCHERIPSRSGYRHACRNSCKYLERDSDGVARWWCGTHAPSKELARRHKAQAERDARDAAENNRARANRAAEAARAEVILTAERFRDAVKRGEVRTEEDELIAAVDALRALGAGTLVTE